MSEKIELSVECQPWIVPNFVTLKSKSAPRQDGFHQAVSIALRDVDANVLAVMCDAFRASIFEKAGKPDPRDSPQAGGGS